MTIRLRIKEIAQGRSIKQYRLAEESGVTPQLLNRYWNNNVQRVDLEELEKIAIALGVEPGALIVSDGKRDDQSGLAEIKQE
jgi:DNA-binding Xre family transcriptional regulator